VPEGIVAGEVIGLTGQQIQMRPEARHEALREGRIGDGETAGQRRDVGDLDGWYCV
jgi:hypothetical protein